MPFQAVVTAFPALGLPGDFADHNPRVHAGAGPGALVAGTAGVTIGRFGWLSSQQIDFNNAPAIVNSFGAGPVGGIVGRSFGSALITSYLAELSIIIPRGFAVPIYTAGGFLVLNEGSGYVQPGMNAYANYANGAVSFASGLTAASAVTAATSSIAAATSAFVAGISGNLMSVSSITSGTIYPGTSISGAGVSAGNQVGPQLSGTPGGVGLYSVTIAEQNVPAGTAIAGTYGVLTLGATPSGVFPVGALLTGTGVAAGTYSTAYITGGGSISGSTLAVNNNTVVGSTTLSAATNVVTKFIAQSGGAVGEIIKMSSHLPG